MMRRIPRAVTLAILFLVIFGTFGAIAQSGLTFFITDVDPSSFPQVQFTMRAIELGNKVVSTLNSSNLTVYENGQQVTDVEVTQHADGPVTYVFVIDQGSQSYFTYFGISNLRQAIGTLVSGGYFVDGRDTVMVLGRQNINSDQTVTLLPATQVATDLTTWVANFNFDRGSGSTKGLLGVEDAIQEMSELVPIPGSQTAAIVYVTRWIQDPSSTVAPTAAQNTAAEARKNFISVHVFHTDLYNQRQDALQVLTFGSDGLYAGLDRNNYLSSVTSVYQSIDAQRTYYTISYRSPVPDVGAREITINTPGRPYEGVIGSYEIELQAPSVNIIEPVANSTIRREAEVTAEGVLPTFDTTNVRVGAEVIWPDGFPRIIKSAQFYANGNLEDSIDEVLDQTQFEFQWDLSDIISEGSNSIQLEVKVEDELGLVAEADSLINVEVVIPTPTPPPDEGSNITLLGAIGLFILFLLVVGAIAGAIYWFVIRPRSLPIETTPEVDVAESMAQTVMAMDLQQIVLATLTVEEGPSGLIGEVFKINSPETVLGRNPAQTDIAFYTDGESSVSRLHCSITLDQDNTFKLTDHNSSAGTRLNGRQIHPDAPVVLADGDEIVLGTLAQRGVKLIFRFATEEDLGPHSGSADDRTHLISDLDISSWESSDDS
jgi:pSer/pThr/pTyr-binding forkhead associated (FHA) protein